jgi:hypothetical protein
MSLKLIETVRVEPRNACLLPPLVGDIQTGFYRGGYAEHPRWSAWIIELFNRTLALALIIVCLPLFVAIGFAVKWRVGGPVFYRGTRMGLRKKPFFMYKFRTAPMGPRRICRSAGFGKKADPHPIVRFSGHQADSCPSCSISLRHMDFAAAPTCGLRSTCGVGASPTSTCASWSAPG